MLGAPCGTSALPADLSPDLQSIRRVRVRFLIRLSDSESVVGPLHAVLGARIVSVAESQFAFHILKRSFEL